MQIGHLSGFFLTLALGGCITLPKGYVKDDRVVYLKQNVGLDPIRYPGKRAEPYRWSANPTVNQANPDFLRIGNFSDVVRPGYQADAKLYAEISQHLRYVIKTSTFSSLRSQIDSGRNVKKLTNGTYVEDSSGKLVKLPGGGRYPSQYQYIPGGRGDQYTLFYQSSGFSQLQNIALIKPSGMRFSLQLKDDLVMVHYGAEMVILSKDFTKAHHVVDSQTRKQGDMISFYYPEGLQIADINKPVSAAVLRPAWPEKYKLQTIGGFSFAYTTADADYLKKIARSKLDRLRAHVLKETGLGAASNCYVILPPNLESYRKLHAGDRAETMLWYPSGFQTKGIIIMWPPSVPKYRDPRGTNYYWNKEFYETLLHEYVHLVISQSTATFSAVPVWLNEGLAVAVESGYAKETRKYWDITFQGSVAQDRLLPWNDVTVRSTSSYAVANARVHYSQSYKMTDFLLKKYGSGKLAKYIRSFRTKMGDTSAVARDQRLHNTYKVKFAEAFGTTWQANLVEFNRANGL